MVLCFACSVLVAVQPLHTDNTVCVQGLDLLSSLISVIGHTWVQWHISPKWWSDQLGSPHPTHFGVLWVSFFFLLATTT